MSVSCRTRICRSVEEAEGQAMLVGLQSLSSVFNGKIILETDNVLIAKELEKGRSNRSDCFQIICEIKDAMTVFESVSIKHIPRECN